MNSIIIGLGQIGSAVKAVTESEHSYDLQGTWSIMSSDIDVMHVCFPYSDTFEQQLREYAAKWKPKHIAVWSTVPIGTCEGIDVRIVHTPVEGKHPDLELSIRFMERWIGTSDADEGKWFAQYFGSLGLKTKVVASSRFTEAVKILSTSEYAINLVFADYKKRIADDLEMPYEVMKQWNQEYNRLYNNLGLGTTFQKFVLDPPNGVIGGHCVVPNAKLLNKQMPSDLLDKIIAMERPE